MSKRLEPEPVPRRDFLGLVALWTALVAILGSVAGMARLVKPRVLPEGGSRFRIGRAEKFPAGTRKVLPEKRIMVLSEEKGIGVISLVCTHLGCIVSPVEEGFQCPCHGSRFDPEGELVRGPAPVGLRWFEVSRAPDGNLIIDAGRVVPRGTFFTV